jgi:hypothetical protein
MPSQHAAIAVEPRASKSLDNIPSAIDKVCEFDGIRTRSLSDASRVLCW